MHRFNGNLHRTNFGQRFGLQIYMKHVDMNVERQSTAKDFGQHKWQAALYGVIMLCMLSGCEKKPQSSENAPVKSAQTEQVTEQTPILKASPEKINVNLPACNDQQCPQIDIQRLSSNYPEIDQTVDRYISHYIKTLVQGFDVEVNSDHTADNVAASESNSPVVKMNEAQHQKNASQPSAQSQPQALTAAQNTELQSGVDRFVRLANEVKALGSSSQLSLFIKPQVLNPKGPIATVVVNASNYIGGAHGSTAQQYFNFELSSKSLLSLDQIIVTGKRKQFNDLAYTAFQDWIKQTQPDMDVKAYQQLWQFTLSENFYLSSEGLILQYGEYEIGPYAIGLPRLIIPYDKLKDILKPQYLPVITQPDVSQSSASAAKTAS